MEIIDSHVHIGRYHLPVEHIDRLLKAAGISRAAVFADPESDNIVEDSTYVLEAAQRLGYFPYFYYGGNAYSGQRPYDRLPLPDNLSEYSGIKWHCWFSPAHDGGLRYSYHIIHVDVIAVAQPAIVRRGEPAVPLDAAILAQIVWQGQPVIRALATIGVTTIIKIREVAQPLRGLQHIG